MILTRILEELLSINGLGLSHNQLVISTSIPSIIINHTLPDHAINMANNCDQYAIVLYCIVLYCIVLYCIVLYCIVLYCMFIYCNCKIAKSCILQILSLEHFFKQNFKLHTCAAGFFILHGMSFCSVTNIILQSEKYTTLLKNTNGN